MQIVQIGMQGTAFISAFMSTSDPRSAQGVQSFFNVRCGPVRACVRDSTRKFIGCHEQAIVSFLAETSHNRVSSNRANLLESLILHGSYSVTLSSPLSLSFPKLLPLHHYDLLPQYPTTLMSNDHLVMTQAFTPVRIYSTYCAPLPLIF